LIRQLIAGFKHAGIKEGDTVLIHSFNSLYYPIIVLGIIGCGASFCGTNPSYTAGELKHTILQSQAKLIICDPDILGDAVTTAVSESAILGSTILFLDTPPTLQTEVKLKRFPSWRTLLTHGEADWLRFDDEETSQKTTAFLFFSSGTTGLPKATQLSHYNLIAQHTFLFEYRLRPYPMRRIVALPMFHVAAAPSTHVSALKAGHIQVIMRRYDPTAFLELINKHGITDSFLVPPQVTSLLMHPMPLAEKKHALRSIKCLWGGAAPLSAALQNAFSALLPADAAFTQAWGMTEVTGFACLLPYPEKDATGSIGRFLPNIDVKILDDEGKDITDFDVVGELAVRGPTVTRGYLNISYERDFDDEGYFRTGDVVHCKKETGLWYIVDRKKDLIKVRGFQVAPAELEAVLISHPGIKDVAILGVGNRGGDSELSRAFVVRKEGWEFGEAEVKKWVEGRLAKYKWLEGGVRFVDEVPKSASGKILKRVLREKDGGFGAKL
jgi:4-coumarate--CoA ligase